MRPHASPLHRLDNAFVELVGQLLGYWDVVSRYKEHHRILCLRANCSLLYHLLTVILGVEHGLEKVS